MTRPKSLRPKLHGKTIVVTGASDGIGRAASRAFALAGAHVVMIGRNEAKTAAAAQAIMSESGGPEIRWFIADLSRQEAVREVASEVRRHCPAIDVLVNNAGALFLDRELTAEGIERTFALNHLAYFTLSLLLLDRLAAAAPSRILCVASRAHREAALSPHDMQLEQDYSGWKAYGNSKLCNILFTRALARRLDPSRVVVHALHPGVVSTRFAVNNGRRGRIIRRVMDVVSVTPDEGADTLVWLAHDPAALRSSGGYWARRRPISPSAAGLDATLAESLWRYSAEVAGIDAEACIAASGVGIGTPIAGGRSMSDAGH